MRAYVIDRKTILLYNQDINVRGGYMELEDAAVYTEKCFNGEPAPCSHACPFRLDVRALIEKTGKGRWNAAYKSLRNAVVFPVIVSSLCPAPCETECLRKQIGDEPVAVRLIEEASVRFAKNTEPDRYAIPPKTERIAVIGAGIAGLSAALCLAQKKYPVTVYEKDSAWGGSLRSHPRFEEFNADITLQFSATETEFRFDTEVLTLEGLSEYDLVYIATGADGKDFGLLPDWEPKLLTTNESKVFMGGALTGADLNGSIVQGRALSKTAEVFLQIGRAEETFDGDKGVICDIDCSDAPPLQRVTPTGPDGYTEEEAKSEAARCLQCDCDMCMSSCEMLSTFRKKPKKIAMEIYTDTKATPPYSTHTITRQVYSCNMCGHCKAICPEDVNIGALVQTSRVNRIESGEYPEAYHDYWLREMDFSTGEASFYAAPGNVDFVKYIFFPGCQLGAHNPDYVSKPYELLKNNYDAGILINCCGAPAYWAGDTKRLNTNLEHIRNIWREHGNPEFVFACATCESVFDEFLPEIPRVSLYELLTRYDGIDPVRRFGKASVFDPCNARKNPDMESAVRELAKKSGAEIYELPEKNRCCGYGGHIRMANPALYDTITENRVAMSDKPYIVYCVNCREVFLTKGKECAHILDIVFDIPGVTDTPRIDEKRDNAMKVKMKMSKELTGMEISAKKQDWDALELIVDDEIAGSIERKLIALSDIKEAIWLAEKSDDKFIDETDGVCQCSMEKSSLTYWVQYKKTDSGAFMVYDAYYHRMRVGTEEA